MDTSLSWLASENPEQIQKIYNIINHKSVNDFYLSHTNTVLSSEILLFLNSSINSDLYKYIERLLTDEFPDVEFCANNIVTFILLYYISQNNISRIIVDIEQICNTINTFTLYDIVRSFKDIRFFYNELTIEIYTSEKIDEKYKDDIFNYTTILFCRTPSLYSYYVHIKSSCLSQSKYNNFPKLFYIKFSNTPNNLASNGNSKLLIHRYKKGITFGTFDLFHYGHDNILKRCRNFCEYLYIGLSSDELNTMKGKKSVDDYEKRKTVIEEAQFGDEIFKEESLELKDDYVVKTGAEILMMGDDWVGKFDWVSCDVLYMERTPNISTTMLKEQLKTNNNQTITNNK
jgi:glycerol-3-phosphate cytidylyltransferase